MSARSVRSALQALLAALAALTLQACGLLPGAGSAHAALAVTGTRFIYPAGLTQQTIRVANSGDQPVLLQTWLDRGAPDADPSTLAVPFLLTPPLVRLDPKGSVALQLRHSGEAMPEDRESVFWINFLEVPPRPPGDNWRLKLAVRLRMKVLYRPRGLDGSPERAIARLRWQLRPGERGAGPTLEARNDSPYFVSLAEVALAGTPSPLRLGGLTVPPFGSAALPLPQGIEALPPGTPLRYQAAGDGGEAIHGEAEIARDGSPAP
ncbi:hypothetical protein BKK81_12875 [Cupriavidus sp. USMAHM13]|uniref:fimbrial biogenesis chaperone n=1 Tax=Cupriavidus sp. USMAHM13 TaxID=1389192 RepID=UPI0008A67B0B|nr:molecular chaperone [Cupriavidus sp. USMAHM13]AOZ00028.1 hypothetical protein BKK81_12875 [Cupriavidus sp. USMAHM13]